MIDVDDLLAALQMMMAEFGRHYLPGSSAAVDAARAALAKATSDLAEPIPVGEAKDSDFGEFEDCITSAVRGE